MTKEELEKYTIGFMNNEIGRNGARLDSIMGRMLLNYSKIFQKRIEELENKNIELLGKIAFTENALNNAKTQIEKMKRCANCEKWRSNQSIIACGICGCIDVRKEL